MKKTTLGAVVAMTFALLVLAASAQAEVTLRFSTCLAKTHDQVETYFQGFYEPFNKMAKGEAKLHYVGGPEVTPRQKQAVALKRGLVDMIFCPMGYFEGTVAGSRPDLGDQPVHQGYFARTAPSTSFSRRGRPN